MEEQRLSSANVVEHILTDKICSLKSSWNEKKFQMDSCKCGEGALIFLVLHFGLRSKVAFVAELKS